MPFIDSKVTVSVTEEQKEKIKSEPVSYTHLDVYKRQVLQTVLQMAVSAWCVLCPFEQGFAVSNESGYRQMCSLRKMRKSLQNGCGRDENA